MIVPGRQKRDSAIGIHVSILPQAPREGDLKGRGEEALENPPGEGGHLDTGDSASRFFVGFLVAHLWYHRLEGEFKFRESNGGF